jgi:protein-disulfide isomerase
LRGYAEALGIDGEKVERAIAQRTYQARIERDVKSGAASNVEGTPALFINGFAYDDEVSLEALSDVIDRALAAQPGVNV